MKSKNAEQFGRDHFAHPQAALTPPTRGSRADIRGFFSPASNLRLTKSELSLKGSMGLVVCHLALCAVLLYNHL